MGLAAGSQDLLRIGIDHGGNLVCRGGWLKDVDACMTPAMQECIVERHPELAFLALRDSPESPQEMHGGPGEAAHAP